MCVLVWRLANGVHFPIAGPICEEGPNECNLAPKVLQTRRFDRKVAIYLSIPTKWIDYLYIHIFPRKDRKLATPTGYRELSFSYAM